MTERFEGWRRRVADTAATVGADAWRQEAEVQWHLRATAEDIRERQAVSLQRCHEYELALSQQASRAATRRREMETTIYLMEQCDGRRTEQCRDCDWSDGKACCVDGRPLGEWGTE